MSYQETTDVLLEFCKQMKNAQDLLRRGPESYYFRKIEEYINILFNRCAPFKIGDRVVLVKDIPVDRDSGWWNSRHFLVAGGKGTVKTVDVRHNKFEADIEFDEETYIDREGKEHSPGHKHTFCISEEYLSNLDTVVDEDGDILRQMWKMQFQLNTHTFKKNDIDDYKYVCEQGNDITREEWVQKYILALRQECAELIDSTNWKWWRTKIDLFDKQNVKVELVDILHFWMSACQVMGMTPEDVLRVYKQKNQVNFERQESGYIEKDKDDCKGIK